MAPGDADVEAMLGTLHTAMLRAIARDYEELLSRPDVEKVLEIFAYAQRLQPDDSFLNQLLGAALLRLGRWEEALPYLERAAALRPQDVTYLSNLAYAYEQAGRDDEALEVLRRLETLEPDSAAIARVKARVEKRIAEKGSER